MCLVMSQLTADQFEDTKMVFSSRKPKNDRQNSGQKKDRQNSGQKKKDKKTIIYKIQHRKLTIEQRESEKELVCPGGLSSSCPNSATRRVGPRISH